VSRFSCGLPPLRQVYNADHIIAAEHATREMHTGSGLPVILGAARASWRKAIPCT
jgi:hypothetical protein